MNLSSTERCPLCLRPMGTRGALWLCTSCRVLVPPREAPLTVEVDTDGSPSSGMILAIAETMVWMRLDESGRTRWVRRSAVRRVELGAFDSRSQFSGSEPAVGERRMQRRIL